MHNVRHFNTLILIHDLGFQEKRMVDDNAAISNQGFGVKTTPMFCDELDKFNV